MLTRIFAMALGIALVLSLPLVASAQETKKEAKKESSKESAAALKYIECAPACGFLVRSHDEGEVVEMTKVHAKRAHGQEMTDRDVKAMMKSQKAEGKKGKGT